MMKILVVFISIISTLGVAILYHHLVDLPKNINIKALLCFIVGVIFIGLVNYFQIEFLGNILFFVYYPILFYLMKPMSFKKISFYTIIVWLYGMTIDLFAMLIVSALNSFYNIDIYSLYFECVLSMIVFVLLIIVANIKPLKKFTNYLLKKFCTIKYSVLVLIFFLVSIFFIGYVIFLNLHSLNTSLLLSLMFVLIFITFIILIKFIIDEKENAKYLKLLRENNEFYIKVEDENRIFKHNLVAKILSIKSVSNKKAMALIEDLLLQFNQNLKFSEGIKLIPYGLDGIIYQKLYPYLKDLDIKISNSINYDIFTVLKPRRYNVLVEKIVVALDNALEAASASKDKIIVVNIYDENNNIVVEIRNTFSNAINIDDLGNKNYTTKGKKHGIGLFSAFRNNEAILNVKIVENYFVSKVSAKKLD